MASADITLTHSSVNSGTGVYLQGTNVTYSVANMTDVKPVQGKYDIAEVNVGGFGENPTIVVEGAINMEDNPSNTITHSLLLDFKQVTTPITMVISGGTTPHYLKGKPTAGYTLGGTYLNQFSVYLKSFSITFNPTESKAGELWHFNATFVETSQ